MRSLKAFHLAIIALAVGIAVQHVHAAKSPPKDVSTASTGNTGGVSVPER